MATLVWFRRDLRLRDNPALHAAAARGPVLPVYIHDPESEGPGASGGASRWWLHHSLRSLDQELRARALRLVVRRGPCLQALLELARESGAGAVEWNRLYEPATEARDAEAKKGLQAAGLEARSHAAGLLREPWELATGQGRPYQVFTPFWRRLQALGPGRAPLPLPPRLEGPARWPKGLALEALGLLPELDWAAAFPGRWSPGEEGAHKALRSFLGRGLEGYPQGRDLPALEGGTSALSPRLHFGELSAVQAWSAVAAAGAGPAGEAWLRELAWRDFSHHLLHHFPATVSRPLRPAFAAFPWARGAGKALRAWQRGLTGYPIVDAGMRELWATGFMHNRVRMIAASFLVKDLLIDWRRGAEWFMDTLVDADLAQNTLGWQWSAGCGADAAPYFRIFNPVSQGERFDPQAAYVRRWVPELGGLPAKWAHKPWLAPEDERRKAGLELGRDYPFPIVDHAEARERALEAWRTLPKTGGA